MSMSVACPQCTMEDSSVSGDLYVCGTCGFEWPRGAAEELEGSERIVRDAVGNVLSDGDSVTLIKDLKLKGSSLTLKQGTKVKNIKLVPGDHEVDCKLDGMSIALKACFLKKA